MSNDMYYFFLNTHAYALFFPNIHAHALFILIVHACVYNALGKMYDLKYVIHLKPPIFFL